MAGVGHETLLLGFLLIFTDKLRDLGLRDEIRCIGSARFGDTRRLISPSSPEELVELLTLGQASHLKWGFPSPLAQLKNDHVFGLHGISCKPILCLSFTLIRFKGRLKSEVINLQCPHHTTVQYSPSVGCDQSTGLREGDVYRGPPLQLLLEKVFDIVPPNLATVTLDFTAPKLQAWNDSFWQDFP